MEQEKSDYFKDRATALAQMVDDILATYDSGNKGYLTYDETKKWAAKTIFADQDAGSDQVFDALFADLDENKNGQFDRVEIEHWVKGMCGDFL